MGELWQRSSNTIYDVDCGSWTRTELDSFIMRLSLGYYGGLIAGATLTGDATGWAISGDGIYQKSNGSWNQAASVSLDDTIGRQ